MAGVIITAWADMRDEIESFDGGTGGLSVSMVVEKMQRGTRVEFRAEETAYRRLARLFTVAADRLSAREDREFAALKLAAAE
jgi:hypothetical protein